MTLLEKQDRLKSGLGNALNTFILLSPPRERSIEDVFTTSHTDLLAKVTKYYCGVALTPALFREAVTKIWKPYQVEKANVGIESFALLERSDDMWKLLESLSYKRDTEEKHKEETKNSRVYTPVKLIDLMIEELPFNVWINPKTTFFDPACGRGVFLLKIKEKLMVTLKETIQDESLREKHIVENMIFGRDIDLIKSKISEKILDYRGQFKTNISFGNSLDKELMMTEYKGKKFDVVIGNPPYNEELKGGGFAAPLYPQFLELAHEMTDDYIMMITPHKWTNLTRLLGHRDNMIFKYGLKYIKMFKDSKEIFGDNIIIKGGVSFFLCEKGYKGKVRYHIDGGKKHYVDFRELRQFPRFIGDEVESILQKLKSEKNVSDIYLNSRKIKSNDNRLTKTKSSKNDIKVLASRSREMWIDSDHKKDCLLLDEYKTVAPFSFNAKECGNLSSVVEPGISTNQSKIMFRTENREKSENLISYMNTTVFKFMASFSQINHSTNSTVFCKIPLLDLHEKWDEEKVNNHFKLNQKEIDFMNKSVEEAEIV